MYFNQNMRKKRPILNKHSCYLSIDFLVYEVHFNAQLGPCPLSCTSDVDFRVCEVHLPNKVPIPVCACQTHGQ